MPELLFKIQNQIFNVPEDYGSLFEFKIKSILRPYQVMWKDEVDVCLEINNILSQNPKNFLLIDKVVYELHKDNIMAERERVYIVEASEDAKTLEGCMKLVDFLQTRGFSKSDILVVVGGGVIQDIAAFTCAVFKRGVPWIFFPTTLLAMCDSCIGGKTGINYKGVKNQLALFSAPRSVIINPQFLKTLPERELKAGLGEMLKLHVTGGVEILKVYEAVVKAGRVENFLDFHKLIFGSLMVKKAVIEMDEFDVDLRKAMNYGHTFGHALEALTNFAIPHGQAVALGMILVDEISNRQNILPKIEKDRVQKLCLDLMDKQIKDQLQPLNISQLIDLLKNDKKAAGASVSLVVLERIGDTIFLQTAIDENLVQEAQSIIISSMKLS